MEPEILRLGEAADSCNSWRSVCERGRIVYIVSASENESCIGLRVLIVYSLFILSLFPYGFYILWWNWRHFTFIWKTNMNPIGLGFLYREYYFPIHFGVQMVY